MKVTILFEQEKEHDGVDTEVYFSNNHVDTIYDLLDLFSDASRGVGFSYVEHMGYSTSDGREVWCKF